MAQRIGTIKDADKIIVLDKGSIVGEGTHDELMERGGKYKEILEIAKNKASDIADTFLLSYNKSLIVQFGILSPINFPFTMSAI